MDYLTFVLLSLGLSLDFSLAFVLPIRLIGGRIKMPFSMKIANSPSSLMMKSLQGEWLT